MRGPGERSREEGVQGAIVRDILDVALPLVSLLLVGIAVASGVTGQYRRLVPTVVYFLVCALAWRWARRGQHTAGAVIVALGSILTASYGVFFNGGLRAPAMFPLIASVAIIGWVGGRRGATLAAGFATLVILTALGLERLEVLPRPDPAALPMLATVGTFAVWIVWAATARPQERLRLALRDALHREEERQRAESRRAESELAFSAVFEQAGQLMLLLEPDGRLVKANRAALAFLGEQQLRAGVVVTETLAWPIETHAAVRRLLERLSSAGEPQHLEVKDERGRRVDLTFSPFRDAQGTLRWVIVQGRDLSALLEEKDREARSHRLALVGQLAGGVAHDFNNVLAVTLACAETLEDDLRKRGQLTGEDQENLTTITSVTQRAADLTRRLLTFGRRVPMERRVRSMHELLGSTMKLLRRTLPPNLELRERFEAKQDQVEADAASVESVLINLAINARDAMPGGGSLTVSTDRVELDQAQCRASDFELTPGPYLRVAVTDTGTGIAPEVLPRIFEPFFTTKTEGKGSGIGLSSVLGAMQQHHGAVRVVSEPGHGATFELLFPLASAAVAQAAQAPVRRELAGLRVLIVDDEPALRTLMGRMAKRLGITAVIEADAEAGLAAFERGQGAFELAILDVVLPGRSGQELAVDLLARSKDLKVLLVSGFTRNADVGALPRERVALLPKPYTLESLRDALSALVRASS